MRPYTHARTVCPQGTHMHHIKGAQSYPAFLLPIRTRMAQTNSKSGFQRTIVRREVDAPNAVTSNEIKLEIMSARRISNDNPDAPKHRVSARMMRREARMAAEIKPTELAEEDALLLRAGQLVTVTKQRADGWAYGSVILDEVTR